MEQKTVYNFSEGKGTYLLVLYCQNQFSTHVGRLGLVKFEEGYYLYTGSAFGGGGVKARVGRHLTAQPSKHWHIDYVKNKMDIVEAWYVIGEKNYEHLWSEKIEKVMELNVPCNNMGSTDCKCKSHFFFSKKRPDFRLFSQLLQVGVEEIKILRLITTF